MSNRAEHLILGGSTWLAAQPDESPGNIFKGCLKENSFNDIINNYAHTMRKWHCSWRGDIHKDFTSWNISRGDLFRLLPIAGGLKTLEVLHVFFEFLSSHVKDVVTMIWKEKTKARRKGRKATRKRKRVHKRQWQVLSM